MSEVIIYTTNTCPRCKILKKKMDDKGIKYAEVNELKVLESKGIEMVPVLDVDNKMLGFKEAVSWVNER